MNAQMCPWTKPGRKPGAGTLARERSRTAKGWEAGSNLSGESEDTATARLAPENFREEMNSSQAGRDSGRR